MRPGMALLAGVLALGSIAWVGCGPTSVTTYDVANNLRNETRFDEAIAEYELFIRENRKSTLIPHALYNIAGCYRGMNKIEKAKVAYWKVINQYPGSQPAEWARSEMRRLDEAGTTPPPEGSGSKGSGTKE